MTTSIFESMLKARLELDERFEQTREEWRQECNARGEEIYYDMSNPKEVGVGCNEDCPDDCEQAHTMLVGQYKTRPCTRHFPGHACNPPWVGKIHNISA